MRLTRAGAKLGTGAYMTALRRTRVGQFNLADAVPPDTKNILDRTFPL